MNVHDPPDPYRRSLSLANIGLLHLHMILFVSSFLRQRKWRNIKVLRCLICYVQKECAQIDAQNVVGIQKCMQCMLYLHKGNIKNLFLSLEVFEEDQMTLHWCNKVVLQILKGNTFNKITPILATLCLLSQPS